MQRLRSFGTVLAAWAAACLVGAGLPTLMAAWDKTKPANSSTAVSSEIRANWSAIESTIGGTNLVADNTMLVWAAGDSAAPTLWSISGTGAAIARTGTGLGDTVTKVGPFSAKLTSGAGAMANLQQDVLPAAAFDLTLRGRSVSCGGWVRAASASSVRLFIFDGGTTLSSAHPGGSTFNWLTVTRTLSGSASQLQVGMQNSAGTVTGYLSGLTCVMGEVPPQDWHPSLSSYEQEILWVQTGTLTTGTDKIRWHPQRPGIVRDTFCDVKTAPSTTSVIVDVNTWDGSAFTSMYSTRPTIVATARRGTAQPDTTYARRCFKGEFTGGTGTPAAGEVLSVDIDAISTGTAGADLQCGIRYLMFRRPMETLLLYNH